MSSKRPWDYVNFRGENVSKISREIDFNVPRKIDNLEKSDYSFFFDDVYREGDYARFYSLNEDVGGKILIGKYFNYSDSVKYHKLRKEFLNHKLAEFLEEGVLPKNYGFVLVKEKSTNEFFPMIIMEELDGVVMDTGIYFLDNYNAKMSRDSFISKKNRIERHLNKKKFNDIDFSNAIYNPFLKETFLIDPAFWKFKGACF